MRSDQRWLRMVSDGWRWLEMVRDARVGWQLSVEVGEGKEPMSRDRDGAQERERERERVKGETSGGRAWRWR